MTAPRPPRVAAIIPVMGHPVLVDDALASAARLLDEGTLARIIAVDDGCLLDETRAALGSWLALLGGGRMAVIRQPNRGLSAARNAGIEAALADPAGIDAIFLLDADNRLARGAGAAFAELLARHPDADWFYPAFDFFGQDGHFATEARPAPLMHMLANHSEAGSLIRRRVFASGLRFAETMRDGYEDWDFFLSAEARGFLGLPAGRPLLEYRKRPASMLSGSHERDGQLRALLARRHRWLFSARAALAREHAGFPRFAFVEPSGVLTGTDPLHLSPTSPAEFEAAVFRHLGAPLRHHVPAMVVLCSAALRARLLEDGLLHGLLWAIERHFLRAPDCRMMAVTVAAGGDLAGIGRPQPWDGEGAAAMIVLHRDALAAAASGALAEGQWPALASRLGAATLALTVPDGAPRAGDARKGAGALLASLAASRFRPSLDHRWDWREAGGAKSRALANEAPRLTASGGPLLPLVGHEGGLDIGFTLPIFDHGGVEKVAQAIAAELTADGHRCHLFIIGGRPARLGGGRPEGWATVSFLSDPSAADWAGAEYMGTAGTSWGNAHERADLEGLLRPMDVVINAHAAAVHRVAGALRAGGTLMIDHEHVLEVSRYGRGYGPPLLALGHEHAYDMILTCSRGMADWLSAHGVPAAKLVPVVNAPGYAMTAEAVAAALGRRRDPLSRLPLSVLYLGRLDEQKGIDRVAAVFRILSAARRGIRLTVAGSAVVDTGGGGDTSADFPPETARPGPLEDGESLTAALVDADILLLASRYEGLPLVVLEAQRLGCVPVATRVGAIGEAITDGVNGVLIDEGDVTGAAAAAILALNDDRARLAELSRNAAREGRDWRQATAELRRRLATAQQAQAQARQPRPDGSRVKGG